MNTRLGESAGGTSRRKRRVRRGVIGVLRRSDRLLMIRRAEGVPKGGAWCFPGGHVERGETSRLALKREFAEELGIAVEPTVRIGSLRVLDSLHILAVWVVEQVTGEIRPAPDEIAEVRWLTPHEARRIAPSLPSNETVLRMLGH